MLFPKTRSKTTSKRRLSIPQLQQPSPLLLNSDMSVYCSCTPRQYSRCNIRLLASSARWERPSRQALSAEHRSRSTVARTASTPPAIGLWIWPDDRPLSKQSKAALSGHIGEDGPNRLGKHTGPPLLWDNARCSESAQSVEFPFFR